jgi:hypothetical protein
MIHGRFFRLDQVRYFHNVRITSLYSNLTLIITEIRLLMMVQYPPYSDFCKSIRWFGLACKSAFFLMREFNEQFLLRGSEVVFELYSAKSDYFVRVLWGGLPMNTSTPLGVLDMIPLQDLFNCKYRSAYHWTPSLNKFQTSILQSAVAAI